MADSIVAEVVFPDDINGGKGLSIIEQTGNSWCSRPSEAGPVFRLTDSQIKALRKSDVVFTVVNS